jgi:glycosyltransferase involved in cell wall biosynthesis
MATKIVIITDAWDPQVNGVVTTYKNIIKNTSTVIEVIHPGLFKNFAFPFYKGIDIAKCSYNNMEDRLTTNMNLFFYSTKFHIATEGPLGLQARRVLEKWKIPYTSAYHTKFPEFINKMYGIPVWMTKWYFNWFHKNSKLVMCSSKSNAKENSGWNSVVLGKGYDEHFKFADRKDSLRKTLLFVSRVSKEKNIEDFCKLPNSYGRYEFDKIVVGDGPEKEKMQKKYPNIKFVGYKFGEELASYYQNADVFVFPSKSDTYGIVILESMACGTPVAAYPVTGPIDQIIDGKNGYVDHDLLTAVLNCLTIKRADTHSTVKNISWKNSAKQFVKYAEE